MDPAQLAADAASIPELAACLLAARRPVLRPLAAVLAADLASDVVQRAAVAAYPLGHAWALYHLAQAAHLAWPALVAWLCLRAWQVAPRWPVAALYGAAVVAAGLGAPVADAPVYAAAEGLAVALGLAAWRGRSVEAPLARAALVVLLGEVAVLLAPYAVAAVTGAAPSDLWTLALVARVATWLGLCAVAARS